MFGLRPYERNKNDIYNPFRAMDEFDKNFFGNPMGFFDRDIMEAFKTDIKDEGDHYELEADLPGFNKEDIHLDIDDNMLKISAKRHSEHEEKDKKGKYVRCERSYGSYERQFDLTGINVDDIKAKYDNGVLKLELPKLQETVEQVKHLTIE